MDSKAAVQKAQREILQNLVRWESSISALYHEYSRLFPVMADFWSTLSQEETAHAHLLQALEKTLDEGHIFWNIGHFGPEAVHHETVQVEEAINRAMAAKVSAREAVFAAVKIEASLLESRFYNVVKSDAPEFERVARKLTKATEDHVARIRAQLMETTDDDRWHD